MSKAFLLLALALVIACATATNFYTATSATASDKCEKGYIANGNYIFTSTETNEAWFENEDNAECVAQIGITAAAAILTQNQLQPDACWAATAAGAATWCGVATDATCSETVICATDNQCISGKCAVQYHFVYTKLALADDKEATKENVAAAITAVLEAIKVTTGEGEAAVDTFPCKASGEGDDAVPAPVFTVANFEVSKEWALVAFTKLEAACKTALATNNFVSRQGSECVQCTPFFESSLFQCPCASPEYIFTSTRFTLAEGKKMSDLEKLFVAPKDDKLECIKAKQFIPVPEGKVVVNMVTKYMNDDCTKESSDRGSSDEYKAVVTKAEAVFTFDAPLIMSPATVDACLKDNKFTCATDAACVGVACPKGTACNAENQKAICASGVCEIKEGETAGKCNSASVVGYIVAVVAVVAAFVF